LSRLKKSCFWSTLKSVLRVITSGLLGAWDDKHSSRKVNCVDSGVVVAGSAVERWQLKSEVRVRLSVVVAVFSHTFFFPQSLLWFIFSPLYLCFGLNYTSTRHCCCLCTRTTYISGRFLFIHVIHAVRNIIGIVAKRLRELALKVTLQVPQMPPLLWQEEFAGIAIPFLTHTQVDVVIDGLYDVHNVWCTQVPIGIKWCMIA